MYTGTLLTVQLAQAASSLGETGRVVTTKVVADTSPIPMDSGTLIAPSLPTIANGMDINALVGVMMPRMMKSFEAMRAGEPAKEFDKDELNAELARLPDKPDEQLR